MDKRFTILNIIHVKLPDIFGLNSSIQMRQQVNWEIGIPGVPKKYVLKTEMLHRKGHSSVK